jgi:hypothetical protein
LKPGVPVSDGGGELGERRGDAVSVWASSGFVVSAANVLHERVPGDDRLRGPVGAETAKAS